MDLYLKVKTKLWRKGSKTFFWNIWDGPKKWPVSPTKWDLNTASAYGVEGKGKGQWGEEVKDSEGREAERSREPPRVTQKNPDIAWKKYSY